jgi:multiple sugar transport system ATP-binding protein
MNFLEGSLEGAQVRIGDHTVALPDALRAQLTLNGHRDVVVGLRPEDFELDGDSDGSIGATVEISERLGPEVLAHVRADGLRRADLRVSDVADRDDEGAELSGTLVARFDPSFAAAAGDRVRLRVNASRLQLFDPRTGESIASA